MQQAIIEMSDLSTGYGDSVVVSGVNLTVHRGEIVTLFGASGCGKSTLLHVVAGLLPPMGGTFQFDGRSLVGVNTAIGYMTQNDTLLPWRTVEANIGLPLRLRGVPHGKTREQVWELLRFLDLEAAAGLYPSQLSGGMKRRSLLARSMIYRPDMLLMDEPFAAVDAQLREELQREVKKAVLEFGQTILFVTHDVGEAAVLSDRVLLLGGRPTTVLKEIRSPFDSRMPIADRRGELAAKFEHTLREELAAAAELRKVAR